jgi:VanZ family protein
LCLALKLSTESAAAKNKGLPLHVPLLSPNLLPPSDQTVDVFAMMDVQMAENITTAETSLGYKVARYWLPVVGMLVLMYWFSTDALSGENTRGIIEAVLSWFGYHPGNKSLFKINYFVRKSAHFTEYAVLAALLFRAFRADSACRWRLKWALYSLAVIVSWAGLDEWHQSFTRTRGGSMWDSLLDSSGGLFSLLIIAVFSIKRQTGPSS